MQWRQPGAMQWRQPGATARRRRRPQLQQVLLLSQGHPPLSHRASSSRAGLVRSKAAAPTLVGRRLMLAALNCSRAAAPCVGGSSAGAGGVRGGAPGWGLKVLRVTRRRCPSSSSRQQQRQRQRREAPPWAIHSSSMAASQCRPCPHQQHHQPQQVAVWQPASRGPPRHPTPSSSKEWRAQAASHPAHCRHHHHHQQQQQVVLVLVMVMVMVGNPSRRASTWPMTRPPLTRCRHSSPVTMIPSRTASAAAETMIQGMVATTHSRAGSRCSWCSRLA
jgi:hypothetical protein